MEEREFKCALCHKKINLLEIHHLYGNDIVDSDGFKYNTGNNYCKECYKNLTTSINEK